METPVTKEDLAIIPKKSVLQIIFEDRSFPDIKAYRFDEILDFLMKRDGIKKAHLNKLLGISQQAVHDFFKKERPSLPSHYLIVLAICSIFNLSPEQSKGLFASANFSYERTASTSILHELDLALIYEIRKLEYDQLLERLKDNREMIKSTDFIKEFNEWMEYYK